MIQKSKKTWKGVIEGMLMQRTARVHLLATSRQTPLFVDAYEAIKVKVKTAERIYLSQELMGDGIRSYIHGRLEDEKKFGHLPHDVREQIEETLVEKSCGM